VKEVAILTTLYRTACIFYQYVSVLEFLRLSLCLWMEYFPHSKASMPKSCISHFYSHCSSHRVCLSSCMCLIPRVLEIDHRVLLFCLSVCVCLCLSFCTCVFARYLFALCLGVYIWLQALIAFLVLSHVFPNFMVDQESRIDCMYGIQEFICFFQCPHVNAQVTN
jgi:hypothetical protein